MNCKMFEFKSTLDDNDQLPLLSPYQLLPDYRLSLAYHGSTYPGSAHISTYTPHLEQ